MFTGGWSYSLRQWSLTFRENHSEVDAWSKCRNLDQQDQNGHEQNRANSILPRKDRFDKDYLLSKSVESLRSANRVEIQY